MAFAPVAAPLALRQRQKGASTSRALFRSAAHPPSPRRLPAHAGLAGRRAQHCGRGSRGRRGGVQGAGAGPLHARHRLPPAARGGPAAPRRDAAPAAGERAAGHPGGAQPVLPVPLGRGGAAGGAGPGRGPLRLMAPPLLQPPAPPRPGAAGGGGGAQRGRAEQGGARGGPAPGLCHPGAPPLLARPAPRLRPAQRPQRQRQGPGGARPQAGPRNPREGGRSSRAAGARARLHPLAPLPPPPTPNVGAPLASGARAAPQFQSPLPRRLSLPSQRAQTPTPPRLTSLPCRPWCPTS